MALGDAIDPARVAVWASMAEHFLDDDSRDGIPRTALCCVGAGLSREEARAIWRHEVSPAVGPNLWSPVGAWGAWDQAWLIERIVATRRGLPLRGVWRLLDRVWWDPNGPTWAALEGCIDALHATPAPARERLTAQLAFLTRHACGFELHPGTPPEGTPAIYPEPFRTLIAPVLSREEVADGDRRIRAALAQAG